MRTVVDTCVILAAGSKWVIPYESVTDNSAREVMKKVLKEHIGIYSPLTMAEYIQKLNDRNHPQQRIREVVGLLMGAFEYVNVSSLACNPSPIDPDDVPFMLCAFDGNADILISEDNHFLELKNKCSAFKIMDIQEAVWVL